MKKSYFFVYSLFLAIISCDIGDGSVLDSVKNDTREQNGRPNLPLNLQMAEQTHNSIALSWQDNSKIEDGYLVEISTDGSNFTEVAKLAENVEQYKHSNLSEISKYYFRVSAYNKKGTTNTAALEAYTGISNKLIAHYKFEDNCNDETTNHNAEAGSNYASGPVLPTYTDGPAGFGKAILFNDLYEQFLTLPESPEFSSDHTFSFWFNVNQVPGNNTRLLLNGGYGTGGYIVEFFAGYLIITLYDDTTASHERQLVQVIPNTWYHFTISINTNDNKLIIYRDGDEMLTVNIGFDFIWPEIDLKVAKDYSDAGYFDGLIDDLRFYDGELNVNAANGIYNGYF